MPIRVLDARVAAQIAAGEVIERPASIVKELVENALDAGAKRISVSVRGGGIDELMIQDDGSGIPADEIELAFARHATSKLSSADDLWDIHTLGFRGEALPSIAAVAQVSCVSRVASAAVGTELRIAGGEVQSITSRGCSPGTTFSIRNLFYNVPVRRTFLKSPAAEATAIATVITQYALAYPQVAFTLVRDSKRILQTSGRGELADVLLELYGVEIARQMIPVQARAGEDIGLVEIQGMVSAPTISRSARDGMHLTVNGRSIAARGQISTTIEQAYHTLLMKGRFPIVVLHIRVHPSAVDVNVHPTKSEVKFRQPDLVGHTIERAVRAAVQQTVVIQGWETEGNDRSNEAAPAAFTVSEANNAAAPAASALNPAATSLAPADPQPVVPRPSVEPQAVQAKLLDETTHGYATSQPSTRIAAESSTPAPTRISEIIDPDAYTSRRLAALHELKQRPPTPNQPPAPPLNSPAPYDPNAAPSNQPVEHNLNPQPAPKNRPVQSAPVDHPQTTARIPPLRALAQLGQTYLLTEGPEGALYLIDQHAAHERITYERLLAQHAAGALQSQTLLLPLYVALPPAAQQALLSASEDLAAWCFTLNEAAGGVDVLAVPAGFALEDLPTALTDLASHIDTGNREGPPRARSDAMLATLACHTSVRAGQTLSLIEQQALLDQLAGCEGPRTCPHGRPTLMVLTRHQLEQQFGRLGA